MPARFSPATARCSDHRAVHPERDDGRPAHGGQPFDACPVRAPREVLAPRLHAWVEERRGLSGERVERMRGVGLELVARTAGAAHVLEPDFETLVRCLGTHSPMIPVGYMHVGDEGRVTRRRGSRTRCPTTQTSSSPSLAPPEGPEGAGFGGEGEVWVRSRDQGAAPRADRVEGD